MLLENDVETTPVVETPQDDKTQEEETATVAEKQEREEKPESSTTSEEEQKSFTQEMVDEIVRNRLERDRKATYKRYGVEDKEGLDSLIGKSQAYDVMKERFEKIKGENASLHEKMAFVTNNINPSREDDIRAYFKGKGLEFNEESLVKELETHPEWRNVAEVNDKPQTTIEVLGVEHKEKNIPETEAEKQRRIFGI